MFYYLFKYLDQLDFPGAGVFQYISFRAAAAIIVSLVISMIFGKKIISFLRKKQIGETIRDLGLEGQNQKQGTPTMGGLIILASILIPTLLFAKLHNIYIILMIISTVWLGLMGFLDDYIKVFKHDKKGLKGKFKVLGQVGLGLFVGLTIMMNDSIAIREKQVKVNEFCNPNEKGGIDKTEARTVDLSDPVKSTKTTIPFFKNNEFDYQSLVSFMGDSAKYWVWVVFVIAVILIVTAVSNGANMTDGLDGLATGTSSIIGTALLVLAYVSGHKIFASYLNIMYIPLSEELVVFAGAFVGATVGFLWYNSYPAQVFMGDTGSLALGGIIAVFAVLIRKEILLPLLCGIFLIENLSVMIQVSYYKYTKRKYGTGKRVFLMSPLHHHYQKKGFTEAKIVTRFWLIGILLAIMTIATLKLR